MLATVQQAAQNHNLTHICLSSPRTSGLLRDGVRRPAANPPAADPLTQTDTGKRWRADGTNLQSVITCVVEYVIDPAQIDAFERFARRWMELVNLHGR